MDLVTATGPYVATVPDIWLIESNTKCYYPRSRGALAAMKREPIQSNWEIYGCDARKSFSKLFNITTCFKFVFIIDCYCLSDSYEESRSKENQATMQTDINSESDQHTPMGRGHRSKKAPGRYLHTKTVRDERSSNDESEEDSVGMYGATQNLVQETFVTTPVIPPGLVSNAVSQPATNLVNYNQPSFPYDSTPALPPTQLSFPIHANRVGLVNQLFPVHYNFFGPSMLISHGFQGQHLPAQLHQLQSSQSSGVLEQVQSISVITPGLADQSSEASDGNAYCNSYCVIVFKKYNNCMFRF